MAFNVMDETLTYTAFICECYNIPGVHMGGCMLYM